MKFSKSKLTQIRANDERALDQELKLYQTLIYVHGGGFILLVSFLTYLFITHSQSPSFWVIIWTTALLGLDAIYFLALRRRRREELTANKSWDDLTGAWSSSYFENKLQEEVMSAGRYRYPLSVCAINLDHFRSFNENFGPKRGDELLKQFSSLIQSHIRATDLLARFEDDSFYLLLPHTDLIRSERVVERLLEQSIEDLDVRFRAGITSYQVGENLLQLQNRTKAALDNSQKEGNKRVQCLVSAGDHYTTIEF